MCSLTAGVIGALGAVSNYMQAEAQEEMAEHQHDIAVRNAELDAQRAQNQLDQQAMEQAQATANERENLELETRRAIAQQRAGSAESGIGGISPLRQLVATNIQSAGESAIINTNLQNFQTRQMAERSGVEQDRQRSILQSRATRDASKTGTLGKVVGAGTSGLQLGSAVYSVTK